jgi:dTMP kinase
MSVISEALRPARPAAAAIRSQTRAMLSRKTFGLGMGAEDMVLMMCLRHSVRAYPRYHARPPAPTLRPFWDSVLRVGAGWGYTGPNVATTSGRLIAIEGIDGSGKGTQLELLQKALRVRGVSVHATNFPHYQSWFGSMVGQFLNGKFGALENVDPHFAALLYAGDRFEAKSELTDALAQGRLVLADRYIASNLAHQTGRVPAAERAAFIEWLEHLEYNIYGLPREDRVIYLRVPPAQAQALVSQKTARSYTTAKQDIQESSLRHLQDAAEMYDQLAKRSHWATVECVDRTTSLMRTPEEIGAELLELVESTLATGTATAAAAKDGR